MEYRIKPPTDSTFGRSRTYFTEYDPVVQHWYYDDSLSHLQEKIKLLSLLNDTITVAAAHIVRSEVTFNQLAENRSLLEEGIVVPAINSDFDSFADMVDRKLTKGEYADPWTPRHEPLTESKLFCL